MYKKDTMCVRSVRCTKAAFGAIATPIFQSATFVHEGIDKESEYSYSRMQNPTRAALENRIAELEGGFDAIAFSSGMAAETALMNLFESSGHIISGDDLYGGTLRLFRHNAVSAGLRSVSPSNGLAGFFVFMNIFLSGGLSGPVSVFPEILSIVFRLCVFIDRKALMPVSSFPSRELRTGSVFHMRRRQYIPMHGEAEACSVP